MLIDARDKIRKINEEIILISNQQIKNIEEKRIRALNLNNDLIAKLYEKYLEGELNQEYYNELMTNDFYEVSVRMSLGNDLAMRVIEKEEQLNIMKDKYGTYKGNLLKIPEGKGTFTYYNGDVYEGEWINGKKNGKGILTLKDGDVYSGDFSNNLFNGKGIYKSSFKNI